jgi:hypothetical protein
MRVAASHSRLRRVAKTVGMLILAVMTAAGTPDLGIAQTMSFSQPVTVLRGQPATPSNQADQADQSVPTAEAPYPNWYPYSYYYPYWWYAGPLGAGVGMLHGFGGGQSVCPSLLAVALTAVSSRPFSTTTSSIRASPIRPLSIPASPGRVLLILVLLVLLAPALFTPASAGVSAGVFTAGEDSIDLEETTLPGGRTPGR